MKSVDLVSLDTETGELRRYRSDHGCHVRETGRALISGWHPLAMAGIAWDAVAAWIEGFRTAYVEPEAPPPRPTSPMRDQRMSMAA